MSGRVSYLGGIVKDGLVLDLDAGKLDSYNRLGTTWNDVSGNGNNGTLTNFSSPSPQKIWNSNNGGSIIFDGTNDYVSLGTLSNLVGKTNVSVECWFYNNSTLSTYQSVIGQFDGVNGWLIHTSTLTNYKILVCVGDGAAFGGVNDTPTGSWIHVVLAYDGTLIGNTNRLKMYVNGVLRAFSSYQGGTVPASWPNATSVNTNIGALLPSYGRYFNGNIPSVKIYTKTLSASEVLQNYNATKGRYI